MENNKTYIYNLYIENRTPPNKNLTHIKVYYAAYEY